MASSTGWRLTWRLGSCLFLVGVSSIAKKPLDAGSADRNSVITRAPTLDRNRRRLARIIVTLYSV